MPDAPSRRRRAGSAVAPRRPTPSTAPRLRGRFVFVEPREDIVSNLRLANKSVIVQALVDLLLATLDARAKRS